MLKRCRAVALSLAAALLVASAALRVHAAADPCAIEGVERIVAIGDVHGAADSFVAILRTTGLIDARDRWSGGRAHLVQLGDIVDRGGDSRKALDLLRRLEREASSAGGGVHMLLGNHEAARMLGDLRFVSPGEYQAFVTRDSERNRRRFIESVEGADPAQLLQQTPLGWLELRVEFGRTGTYGRWLRSLETVVKIDGVLFVHGGISPAVAAMSCHDINATVRRELGDDLDQTRAAPLQSLAARQDGPLWYRGLVNATDADRPAIDDMLLKQHARAAVVGHTISPDRRIRVLLGGRVVQIDTGMQTGYVPDGRPSALEIRGSEFTAIYQDSREPLTIGEPSK